MWKPFTDGINVECTITWRFRTSSLKAQSKAKGFFFNSFLLQWVVVWGEMASYSCKLYLIGFGLVAASSFWNASLAWFPAAAGLPTDKKEQTMRDAKPHMIHTATSNMREWKCNVIFGFYSGHRCVLTLHLQWKRVRHSLGLSCFHNLLKTNENLFSRIF